VPVNLQFSNVILNNTSTKHEVLKLTKTFGKLCKPLANHSRGKTKEVKLSYSPVVSKYKKYTLNTIIDLLSCFNNIATNNARDKFFQHETNHLFLPNKAVKKNISSQTIFLVSCLVR